MELEEIRKLHQTYLDAHRAAGSTLLTYQTPCCGHETTTAAIGDGEPHDSTAVCLGCGQLYWRVITDDDVRVSL
ncbi:hypothetical protein CF106_08470 [Aeromonas veronii]|nr:hypothetical protein CF106_08470 [Aeromonas veronii]